MPRRRTSAPRTQRAPDTPRAQRKIAKVMGEFKDGGLRSGSGAKVRKRKQAIAIALSEARRTQRTPKRRSRRRSA
jgi:hypothetical protein